LGTLAKQSGAENQNTICAVRLHFITGKKVRQKKGVKTSSYRGKVIEKREGEKQMRQRGGHGQKKKSIVRWREKVSQPIKGTTRGTEGEAM